MFCPRCRDEFRPGFSRCESCKVDLVEELPEPGRSPVITIAPRQPVKLVEFCGFFALDEARGARDLLRASRIRSEIVVREGSEVDWSQPAREEYWLRVDGSRLPEVAALLGEVPEAEEQDQEEARETEQAEDDSDFACGACGQIVAADETFCPKCGARFDG